MTISTISEIIADLQAGRMVILIDEETRENEGDLVIAADHVTPEAINFMATHGRGLICLTISEQRSKLLDLEPISQINGATHSTPFAVSIDASEGVTTGISATDRAKTIRAAIAKDAVATDLVRPGHVFPLIAQNGGVLVRPGHTEAGCDLAKFAGLEPSSVICEIMNDDGSMARLPQLRIFAERHGLKIGKISDIIAYRCEMEALVDRVGSCRIDTSFGAFQVVLFRDVVRQGMHLALVQGHPSESKRPILVLRQDGLTLLDFLDKQASEGQNSLQQNLNHLGRAETGAAIFIDINDNSKSLTRYFSNICQQKSSTGISGEQLIDSVFSKILDDLGVNRELIVDKLEVNGNLNEFDDWHTGYSKEAQQKMLEVMRLLIA